MTPKERVLGLLKKDRIDRMPCFSGQGMITLPAIEEIGIRFPQVHISGENMANAAIATMKRYGFDSAVVPFDMCTIPEALGLKVSLYEESEDVLYPTIPYKCHHPEDVKIPANYNDLGRMPEVSKAISILKKEIGNDHAIGSWVLGPFTLAGQLVELDVLMKMTYKEKATVERLLDELVELIIDIGMHYRAQGADYLNLREMGTGSDLLSPRTFREMIKPRLERIFNAWDSPKILHICGATDLIIEIMNECGADALSVDQKNNLAESRRKIGDSTILLGNFDPYKTLCSSDEAEVEDVIKKCIDDGADAVWPGCDIWPMVKEENMRAYIMAVKKYGKGATPAVGRL
jgi:[methyl-Co(III) methanol-specific corrinoid protein]:coenzyme M methyltransferase